MQIPWRASSVWRAILQRPGKALCGWGRNIGGLAPRMLTRALLTFDAKETPRAGKGPETACGTAFHHRLTVYAKSTTSGSAPRFSPAALVDTTRPPRPPLVVVDCVGLAQHRQVLRGTIAVADVPERAGHIRFPESDPAAVAAPDPDLLDPLLLDPLPNVSRP